MRRGKGSFAVGVVALVVILAVTSTAKAAFRLEDDESTKIHRLHVLMNHGMIMFLDGINTKMIADMGMSPAIDPKAAAYSVRHMKMGRKIVEMGLHGELYEFLVELGFKEHPLMVTARELGENMLELMDVLESMKVDQMADEMMDMHHMHLLANEGLEDVVQGSNMIMATLLSSIPEIDQFLQNHGRNMVKDGRAVIEDMIASETYINLKQKEKTPGENSFASQTKRCADLSLKIADILSRMEIEKSAQ
jgi:hypothetical protein